MIDKLWKSASTKKKKKKKKEKYNSSKTVSELAQDTK